MLMVGRLRIGARWSTHGTHVQRAVLRSFPCQVLGTGCALCPKHHPPCSGSCIHSGLWVNIRIAPAAGALTKGRQTSAAQACAWELSPMPGPLHSACCPHPSGCGCFGERRCVWWGGGHAGLRPAAEQPADSGRVILCGVPAHAGGHPACVLACSNHTVTCKGAQGGLGCGKQPARSPVTEPARVQVLLLCHASEGGVVPKRGSVAGGSMHHRSR
jgi:hypothetical protein